MPIGPESVMYALGAVVCALVGFAALLLAGQGIVRLLRLSQDLPEGPRYEPPPPALATPAEAAGARQRAIHQQRLRDIHACGLSTLRIAEACRDLALETSPAGADAGGDVDGRQRLAALVAAADTAGRAALEAERTMRLPDPDLAERETRARLATAEAALAAARAARGDAAPAQGNRTLWILLAVGLALVLWLLAMSLLVPRG